MRIFVNCVNSLRNASAQTGTIVALLTGNPLRNLLLAAHRINGDKTPGKFKHF